MTEAIIEAAARALCSVAAPRAIYRLQTGAVVVYVDEASAAVLAAVTPLIEAAALERAARAFEPHDDGHDSHSSRWTAEEVAAAIRALAAP